VKYLTALVTGGAGFIGSHLVQQLLRDGLNVIVLDDLSLGRRENIPSEASFVEGDMLDTKLVASILKKKVDVVFHLAAKVTIRGSASGFYDDAQTNIMGTLSVLKACLGTSVDRFVFSSSMAVYGDSPTPDPISENHIITPKSPYGISKYAGELYVKNICETAGINFTILRYFNTYGLNQSYTPYVGAITIFITQLLNNKPLTVFSDGSQCRDFVSVEDIVQGTIKALHPNKEGLICNLGTGKGSTVNDIISFLANYFKIKPDIRYEPKRPEELVNSVANIQKARDQLGYSPKYFFPEKIIEVIDYLKSGRQE